MVRAEASKIFVWLADGRLGRHALFPGDRPLRQSLVCRPGAEGDAANGGSAPGGLRAATRQQAVSSHAVGAQVERRRRAHPDAHREHGAGRACGRTCCQWARLGPGRYGARDHDGVVREPCARALAGRFRGRSSGRHGRNRSRCALARASTAGGGRGLAVRSLPAEGHRAAAGGAGRFRALRVVSLPRPQRQSRFSARM